MLFRSFQFGGIIGVLSLGVLADRFGYYRVLACAFVALFVSVAGIGLASASVALIAMAVTCTGLFLVGANNTLNAFATTLYPTSIRSTGVSWGSSFGRLTGSAGPYLGGLLLGAMPLQPVFFIFAIPALCGAAFILAMLKVRGTKQREAALAGV